MAPNVFQVCRLAAIWDRARIRYLARTPRPVAFTARWGVAMVHKSLRHPGAWRCTWFDHHMEPMGDSDHRWSFEAALRRACDEGAHLFNELPRTEPTQRVDVDLTHFTESSPHGSR